MIAASGLAGSCRSPGPVRLTMRDAGCGSAAANGTTIGGDKDERERLLAALRPAVEEGRGVWRMAHSYLWAVEP